MIKFDAPPKAYLELEITLVQHGKYCTIAQFNDRDAVGHSKILLALDETISRLEQRAALEKNEDGATQT